MDRKRTFLTISLSVLLLIFLSACEGETSPAADSPAENEPANSANLPADENANEEQEEVNSEPEPEVESTEAPQPEEPSTEPADQVSFAGDVFPILESRCLNCHGGERTEGDFLVTSYDNVLNSGKDGPVVIPGDADASYMAELILDQKMPKRGPKLTPIQTQTIIDWINQGAQNN
jgi:hypothetical protein